MKEFFTADLNDDGRVTLEEMAAVNRNRPGVSPFDVVGAPLMTASSPRGGECGCKGIGPAQARDYGVGAILIGLLALDLDKDDGEADGRRTGKAGPRGLCLLR